MAYQQGNDMALQRKFQEAKMAQVLAEQERQKREDEFYANTGKYYQSPQRQALDASGGLPTQDAAIAMQGAAPRFDTQAMYQDMLGVPGLAKEAVKGLTATQDPIKLGEGETLLDPRTMKPMYQAGPKLPWYVQRGEGGAPAGINPLFREFELTKAQAGAARNNTNINIDNKKQMSVVEPFLNKLPENYQAAVGDKMSISRIDQALEIVKKGGDSVTGLSGAVKSAVAPYATAIGMNTAAMNDSQILQTLLDANAGSLRMEVVGPGPVSNYEQGILQRVSGRKMSAAEGVKKVLEYHRGNKEEKIKSFNNQLDRASKLPG
ncbi:MAG: hypothetical protein WC047_00510 [Kiritimatiellales bacterium]